MAPSEPIQLKRDTEVIEIPAGTRSRLAAGTTVRIMQTLGGSFTVTTPAGCLYRVDASDADALGRTPAAPPAAAAEGPLTEQMVWDQLKTVFDPEIPANIVDLGLVYSCQMKPLETGGHRIEVKMTMTAPGCGMAGVLKADVEGKLARLPDVREVNVEVVFDPPWHPGRMSAAAKLQLGLDADFGGPSSPLPLYPPR